jgi:hypothetical protein
MLDAVGLKVANPTGTVMLLSDGLTSLLVYGADAAEDCSLQKPIKRTLQCSFFAFGMSFSSSYRLGCGDGWLVERMAWIAYTSFSVTRAHQCLGNSSLKESSRRGESSFLGHLNLGLTPAL